MAKKPPTFQELLNAANAARHDPRIPETVIGKLSPEQRAERIKTGKAFEDAKRELQGYLDKAMEEKGHDHPDVQEMRRLAHILLR